MTQNRDPANADNFRLVCKLCGWKPPLTMTMGEMRRHFVVDHPEAKDSEGAADVQLELIWIGKGPAPKAAK